MLGRLVLLAALVVAILWWLDWFRRTPPQQVAKTLRLSLLLGALGLLLVLAVTGRLNPLFAALAGAVALFLRLFYVLRLLPLVRQILRHLGLGPVPGAETGEARAGSGPTSSIRTRFLAMTLDHQSGEMDGQVLEGPLRDRLLSRLDEGQLADLYGLCRSQDDESAAVLEAYLDRRLGPDWRENWRREQTWTPPSGAGAMNEEEAYAVLGLPRGASADEIRGAHRRLMQRIHPDRGGSDYLAAKINQAKRLLLGE